MKITITTYDCLTGENHDRIKKHILSKIDEVMIQQLLEVQNKARVGGFGYIIFNGDIMCKYTFGYTNK